MTSTSNVTIGVSPSPGFCIKSNLLQPGILNVTSADQPTRTPVPTPQGLKVFVNIAWSKDVPPPLDGVEKVLESVAHDHRMDPRSESADSITVFASDGRLDVDKGTATNRSCLMNVPFAQAIRVLYFRCTQKNQLTDLYHHLVGKPALIFDCIYNSSLKHHASKDAEFRNCLIGTCAD
jgi:hypothetical protein